MSGYSKNHDRAVSLICCPLIIRVYILFGSLNFNIIWFLQIRPVNNPKEFAFVIIFAIVNNFSVTCIKVIIPIFDFCILTWLWNRNSKQRILNFMYLFFKRLFFQYYCIKKFHELFSNNNNRLFLGIKFNCPCFVSFSSFVIFVRLGKMSWITFKLM